MILTDGIRGCYLSRPKAKADKTPLDITTYYTQAYSIIAKYLLKKIDSDMKTEDKLHL